MKYLDDYHATEWDEEPTGWEWFRHGLDLRAAKIKRRVALAICALRGHRRILDLEGVVWAVYCTRCKLWLSRPFDEERKEKEEKEELDYCPCLTGCSECGGVPNHVAWLRGTQAKEEGA